MKIFTVILILLQKTYSASITDRATLNIFDPTLNIFDATLNIFDVRSKLHTVVSWIEDCKVHLVGCRDVKKWGQRRYSMLHWASQSSFFVVNLQAGALRKSVLSPDRQLQLGDNLHENLHRP